MELTQQWTQIPCCGGLGRLSHNKDLLLRQEIEVFPVWFLR
jgi:hypothetical protein